jgi:polar amino acid transport system substrate-binding protein
MLAIGFAVLPLAGFARELRVGVSGSPPFVIRADAPDGQSSSQGISVDVWEEIAERNGLAYRLVPMASTEANVRAVGQGDLDLAIGPISITAERLKSGRIEFSQPYFYGQVGVLLPAQPPSLWSRIRPFFGVAALSSVGVLVLSLFLVGNLIWLAERRRNPDQFPRSYGRGVGNGMWFALVTLTTVGYGDRAPVTAAGRFLAGAWMVLTLLAVSSITAGLASAFTVSLADTRQVSIREPADLRGVRLAVVAGTTSGRWADVVGARAVVSASLEQAVALLRQRRVEGVLFDQPALRYALRQHPEAPLRLAPFGLGTQTYGLVLPADSELRLPLDVSLLELHRDGGIEAITDRWLGS